MVNVYIWNPLGIAEALAVGVIPDLGHAALEVIDSDGTILVYASFWPEVETLVGLALHPFKRRVLRHPPGYGDEVDPEQGYMQRPPDYTEHLEGLDEERITREWRLLADSMYDLHTWNCSNVTQLLLLRAMPATDADGLLEQACCTVEDLQKIQGDDEFWQVIRYLATSGFISCRPDDVLRLVRAYNAVHSQSDVPVV